MSNGAECCALEICCPPAEAKARLVSTIAQKTGATVEHATAFLDWMAAEDLIFAPASLKTTLDHIVSVAKAHA